MNNKKSSSLVDDFLRYFELSLATSPEQLENVFRVRYRVYCEEFGYEPADAFPDQLEKDEFDGNASHCLVTHKSTGMPAGCARLVLTDENSLLPLEKYCSSALDQSIIRAYDGKRHTICEFSRLGVDGAFRRRPGERETRFGEIAALDCSQREERTFSLIAVASILSGLAMSDVLGRPHCFAMMEAFLPRLLRRSGLIVHPAGTEMEYHGTRTPYYFETQTLIDGAVDELKEFYDAIRQAFADSGSLSSENVAASASIAPDVPARDSSGQNKSLSTLWTPLQRPAFDC